MSRETLSTEPPVPIRQSPWLDVRQAAQHANCGHKSIYNAVASGRLRAARLGGRRELRFLAEWLDDWLLATSTPVMVSPSGARTKTPVSPIVISYTGSQ
jgi:excisionase family DNA binding protein